MAVCANCGRMIVFGGSKDGELRFCGKACQAAFHINRASAHLPDGFILEKAAELHAGPCPKCSGPGPVDVHMSYWVWSAVEITRWSRQAEVCCKRRGNRAKWKAIVFSGLLGWWGFPWGLFMPPAMIIRNVGSLVSGPDPTKPSDELVEIVRVRLSSQVMHEEHGASAAPAQG